ncbi:MAG TPA: hypothetical protein ENI53_02640 [Thermoplasmatales archaeon]|nr:hypothetical protein [Thermoplasmatales archaeon]
MALALPDEFGYEENEYRRNNLIIKTLENINFGEYIITEIYVELPDKTLLPISTDEMTEEQWKAVHHLLNIS